LSVGFFFADHDRGIGFQPMITTGPIKFNASTLPTLQPISVWIELLNCETSSFCATALESRQNKAYPVRAPMNVRTSLVVLVLCSAVCTVAQTPPEYTPAEAPRHIGETASVTGAVKRVYQTQAGSIFLDLGATHPRNPFTVFIPRSAADRFANFREYDGLVITVSGHIQEYNSKAEIVVTDPSQIIRGSVPGL
jgi:hypothetical protein